MKTLSRVFLYAVAIIALGSVANAGTVVYGPYPGYEVYFTASVDYYPVVSGVPMWCPFCLYDWTEIAVTVTGAPVWLYVPTYFIVTDVGNPPERSIWVYDIWAQAVNVPGDPLALSGFDPANPQVIMEAPEHFQCGGPNCPFIVNAPEVTAPIETLTVADLELEYGSTFDLAAFAGADPASIVYMASAEIGDCPEPAAFLLVGAGLLAAGVVRRKRRLAA